MSFFWVACGSALGGMARYGCADLAAVALGERFPAGTILVNVLGSWLIGWFGALTGPAGRFPVGLAGRQFVMVGICGGFTTFSAFSLQTLILLRQGAPLLALANIAVSVVLCLGAVALGHRMAAR